ncbi:hypothetical protein [Breoghania sp.]|uniref:hypothetical protein n=1 Tax=Breoghania sp. TaxID=2065378 RepID=UPI00261CB433|nr:hypothetical protein [Breoghania sp.]MDJ0932089.1 hypothetical protein [Breoghania sp.]
MEIEEHEGWQALLIQLSDRVLTTVGTDGAGWVLTIGEMILEPSKPLEVQRNMRGNGGSILRIPFGQPVAHHVLVDPETATRSRWSPGSVRHAACSRASRWWS